MISLVLPWHAAGSMHFIAACLRVSRLTQSRYQFIKSISASRASLVAGFIIYPFHQSAAHPDEAVHSRTTQIRHILFNRITKMYPFPNRLTRTWSQEPGAKNLKRDKACPQYILFSSRRSVGLFSTASELSSSQDSEA
ncbi:MAG: hypothetical protein H8E53_06960 [Planctomycetes bacterium]|nr:hypothetical protein [Planctomycetota bacterium]